MSSIIPTSQSPGLQALTAQTAQIKDTPLAEGAAAADTAAPGSTDAAATDGGDKVELSREAHAELWRAFSKEHFAKIIAASEARHRTGDAEADRITRTAIRAEYEAFEKTYGPRPKGEVELAHDAKMAKYHELMRKNGLLVQEGFRLADIETAEAKNRPNYAVIKDAEGRQVGVIGQNGGASIESAAMALFGGRESYMQIMERTASAPNPAQARFEALLGALLKGGGSIERTGVEYKPFVSRFAKEFAAIHAQREEIWKQLEAL